MVAVSTLLSALAVISSASSAPLTKRIAQVIVDSTAKWEQACLAAGGGEKCNPVSVTAFSTLLAAPGPCEQQDAADQMIDLAKTLNSDPTMIKLTQIFAQQPRNSPTSLSVQYCQSAPKNAELNGLFQCQFQGTNPSVFVGNVPVGQAGTIPFGRDAPVSPPGSCPAHTSGGIADGSQLVDVTQDPGVGSSNGGSAEKPPKGKASPPAAASSPAAAAAAAPSPASSNNNNNGGGGNGDFHLQNGKDAQDLNAKFASLTSSSPCTAGSDACISGQFAQCVGSSFVTTGCASGTTCAALPLVNKPGTSIACTTESDAIARIAATGAEGGLIGSGGNGGDVGGSAAASPAPAPESKPKPEAKGSPAAAPPSSNAGGGDFHLQNGKDAQSLNAKFASLTSSSPCTAGSDACISGQFAQCVGGAFVVTGCASGTTCAALPLVNKPGTSIACTTEGDAVARIEATGATGGLTG